MEESLLNDNSVKQLYNYPESGSKEQSLYFLVYSKEKKENNLFYFVLCDLKYKIENIIIDNPNEIKEWDIILAKKFSYKYETNVEITITDFQKCGRFSLDFLKGLNEYKDDKLIDCFFMYRINNKNFIGFNDEILEYEIDEIESKIELEKSNIYLLHRLFKVNDKKVKYIKNISFISENLGKIISNDSINNLNKNIPYCFGGKIIEANKKKLTIVIPKINKIFFILELNKLHFNLTENKYVRVSSAKYSFIDRNIIYLRETEFTKIEVSKPLLKEEQRIYIKFIFHGNLNIISKFFIELNNESSDEIEIKNNSEYYMYNKKLDFELDYFIQKVNIFYNTEFSRNFEFFVYIGFLNEINVDTTQIGVCAYEFLYYSLEPKYLPNSIELAEKKTFTNFQTFGNKTRKKISFINIQIQNEKDIGHGNSFLVIRLCEEKEIRLYGTMKLNSIEFKTIKEYIFNSTIDEFLKNIHQEFVDFFLKKSTSHEKLEEKYIHNKEKMCLLIENELKQNFNLFKIKNEKHTFEYFDSLVIWNIFNYISKIGSNISNMKQYFEIYTKLEKTSSINYVEKSMMLIGLFIRLKESKISFALPELYFYDELEEEDPYKMAYKFQFSLIDNLTEYSRLFQPFLLLDSYFMDLICYENLNIDSKNVKDGVISSYSISMLPLDYIKSHLKKTIKKYFLIIRNGKKDERIYYASVQNDNGIVTYNEKILFNDTPFEKIGSEEKESIRKNYAFLINFENMHENFSHNKEAILNMKDSPTLYFNEDFNYTYIYENHSDQIGEAGALLESFICDNDTLEDMKKLKYKMGIYFDVSYFIEKNFNRLIQSFLLIRKTFSEQDVNNNIDILSKGYKSINTDTSKQKEYLINNEKKDNQIEEKNLEAQSNMKRIETNKEKNINQEKGEIILLSRYNCVIIKAKTMSELSKKINEMKNKKFIVPKNVIPRRDGKSYY